MPELEPLKDKMRATWMAGDFGKIAEYSAKGAEHFVDSLGIATGMRVLDVACGTGNLAIPAARKGAQVWGIDIAPNLLAQARERAAAENLQTTFEEADAEQLPYPDAQFRRCHEHVWSDVRSAPRACCRRAGPRLPPGGTIAMANWPPDGFVAKQFALAIVTRRHRMGFQRQSCGAKRQWSGNA